MTAAEIKRRRRELENARRRAALEKLRARASSESRIVVPLRREDVGDDWHRRIRLQEDRRDLTARMMGDPPTGRSALDLKQGG